MSSPRSSEALAELGPEVLVCKSLGKEFYYHSRSATSMRERFIHVLQGRREEAIPLFSLRDLSLSVRKGEGVALIGPNGSGKSTALRLMAGIYKPSRGEVITKGHLAAVIELGAGFNNELTGRENIELYGAIMGIGRRRLKQSFDSIVEFAEIGEYIDVPVKFYSSGMYARLAFSVALCVEPDILLIDEVLSVGDQRFKDKCTQRLQAFLNGGGTLVTASHNLGVVRELCSRAVWIEHGKVRSQGALGEVIDSYLGTPEPDTEGLQPTA